MSTDIWGMLGRKRGQSITIPTKKTATNTSNNTTTVEAKPIKPPQVKAHKKTKVQVKKHIHQQTTQNDLSAYDVSTTGDVNGIYITILYCGRPIYKFTLSKVDFDTWQYKMDMNQKRQYVTIRVNANATVFGNDAQIVQTVIMAIYNILNNIFDEAARMRSQQQAHRKMI
jgi:hypothetical protein